MVSRSPENEKRLDVVLEWAPAQGPDGKAYFYPDDHKRLRKAWSKPGVYRWVLSEPDCKVQFVVGEADDLYERLGDYLHSGHEHLVKMQRQFERVRASGGSVGLEILRFDSFAINGVVFDESKLRSFFVRRVLENLCSETLVQQGFELLNDTPEKRQIGKVARQLNVLPAELQWAIREVRSRKATSTSSP